MTEITRNVIKANGINLHYREAGEGPAMILLHGWPQTSYSWRKVISPLSERYRVIAPDLRGMGDSDKPVGGYDMRTVATDIRQLAAVLSLENPYLVGADWGGLVARRYALDWPGELARVAIVDIVPHAQIFANFTVDYAKGAWHYFFNAVPDMPEHLVAHDVRGFLLTFFRPKFHNPANLDDAIDEYVRAYSKPGALRGGFAYYKEMFGENRRLDEESLGKTIQDPIHCIWGNSGGMGGPFDVLEMWRPDAPHVTGRGIDECGHYVHEEAPDILVEELLEFGDG
ncbi:MAG: alpha/beta hydrolase [Alphaproteobacteria bacterium]|nr:alpha/beta hydrolase [Alphaproteobacteria bacterium]